MKMNKLMKIIAGALIATGLYAGDNGSPLIVGWVIPMPYHGNIDTSIDAGPSYTHTAFIPTEVVFRNLDLSKGAINLYFAVQNELTSNTIFTFTSASLTPFINQLYQFFPVPLPGSRLISPNSVITGDLFVTYDLPPNVDGITPYAEIIGYSAGVSPND